MLFRIPQTATLYLLMNPGYTDKAQTCCPWPWPILRGIYWFWKWPWIPKSQTVVQN